MLSVACGLLRFFLSVEYAAGRGGASECELTTETVSEKKRKNERKMKQTRLCGFFVKKSVGKNSVFIFP